MNTLLLSFKDCAKLVALEIKLSEYKNDIICWYTVVFDESIYVVNIVCNGSFHKIIVSRISGRVINI